MSAAEVPLVSVCIPTYRRADLLRRAVIELLACDYPNLEIVISDNGSPDHTRDVAAALCSASSRVRYFRHPHNMGPTKNFEFARAQARGKYFLWHGDDDRIAPDFITQCVRELERDPGLTLAAGLGAYHAGDGVITRYGNAIQGQSSSPLLRVLKYLLLVDENSIFCGVYRREAVAQCAMPNMLAGDWGWVAEVLSVGRAKVLPQTHAYREQGGENTSHSLERIVAVHGLPKWHARHPRIAMPLNLATYLGFRSALAQRRPWPGRLALWLAVFALCITRESLLAIVSKLPFRAALRRLVDRQRKAEAAAR